MWCEIKYVNQLHPARLGYGNCWGFPPLEPSPPTTLPRTEAQGPAIKAGRPDLLPPKSLDLGLVVLTYFSSAPVARVLALPPGNWTLEQSRRPRL